MDWKLGKLFAEADSPGIVPSSCELLEGLFEDVVAGFEGFQGVVFRGGSSVRDVYVSVPGDVNGASVEGSLLMDLDCVCNGVSVSFLYPPAGLFPGLLVGDLGSAVAAVVLGLGPGCVVGAEGSAFAVLGLELVWVCTNCLSEYQQLPKRRG